MIRQLFEVAQGGGDDNTLQGFGSRNLVDEFHLFIGIERQGQALGVVEFFFFVTVFNGEVHIARTVKSHGDHRLVEKTGVDRRLL